MDRNNSRDAFTAFTAGEFGAMKNFIARFVTDQSGAVDFEDGLTVVSLIIGFYMRDCAYVLHGCPALRCRFWDAPRLTTKRIKL